jgi:hypothetical protein
MPSGGIEPSASLVPGRKCYQILRAATMAHDVFIQFFQLTGIWCGPSREPNAQVRVDANKPPKKQKLNSHAVRRSRTPVSLN